MIIFIDPIVATAYLSLRAYDGQLSSNVHELTINVEAATSLRLIMSKNLHIRKGKNVQLTSAVVDFSTSSGPDEVVIKVMDGKIYCRPNGTEI